MSGHIIQNVSYIWSLLCLTSFSYHVFKVHPCCSMYQHLILFLWMSNIPFVDISYIVFIHQFMDIWVVFTFAVLRVMLLCTSFCGGDFFPILLSMYLELELLGHIITLTLTFWGITKLFYKSAAPLYIPISNICKYIFLHILTYTCYCLFHYSHHREHKMVYLVNLICILQWLMILSIFSYTYQPFVYYLWRNIYSNSLPIFYWIIFYCWVLRQALIRYMICNYFLQSHELSFHFLDSVLWNKEGFDFDRV